MPSVCSNAQEISKIKMVYLRTLRTSRRYLKTSQFIEAFLHLQKNGGNAVASGIVRALHRLRRDSKNLRTVQKMRKVTSLESQNMNTRRKKRRYLALGAVRGTSGSNSTGRPRNPWNRSKVTWATCRTSVGHPISIEWRSPSSLPRSVLRAP